MGIKGKVFRFIVTCGFTGYLPFAPGTYGALAACLFLYVFPFSSVLSGLVATGVLMVAAFAAIRGLGYGNEDPGYVTIDEFTGMFVTMVGHTISFTGLAIGFILFRVFDILKPPPVRQLERLHGAYGIMADDIAAGILANAGLHLCLLAWENAR